MESSNNYMNQEDFHKVIDAIPSLMIRKWLDNDIEYLFKILYWSALRPMEGIMLEKENFVLSDRIIKLGKTKTEANDKALIPSVFVDELSEYIETKEKGRLFPDLTYNTFYPWLKKLGILCNIEAWTVTQAETKESTVGHIFRKSIGKDMVYGNQLDKNGKKIEIPMISKHLRHKKPSMTMDNYLKSSLEQVKDIW